MQAGKDGRIRIIIEGVKPAIDGGRFPIKRTIGEEVEVEADIFADGHDLISALLLYRPEAESSWQQVPMTPVGNDHWKASFVVTQVGRYAYTLEGWMDPFRTWQHDMEKRVRAGQDVAVDLLIGAKLLEDAVKLAAGKDARRLHVAAEILAGNEEFSTRINNALDPELARLMRAYANKQFAARMEKILWVTVDREKARYSAWYEFFPRSTAVVPGEHGTFKDCEKRIPYVASMGFDVIYLPPIHPIGSTFRKGKNNGTEAGPEDPGSPWGIGAAEGGHKSILPQLGTLEDFQRFRKRAEEYGIEIALDVAYQCSPDHPYVKEHRDWFRQRPDGTIQYAENPPKKYQDIYPIDFESQDWQGLWKELKSVLDYWIEQGIKIFRVDNPHTKAFPFWEWAVHEIKCKHPEVIFLSEAFTRPRVMYRLAKIGFTQSYTYFAWRNTKAELTQYFTELTQTEVREYFRPNLWPNTPDILTEYLQHGGRPAFMTRLVLAATLGASYGIYGPAYEQIVNTPRQFGSEEYLDSEKYEIRLWDLNHPDSLHEFIALVNGIRKENQALHSDRGLRFHEIDNPEMICYSKCTPDRSNIIMVVVNLDPYHKHAGWLQVPMEHFGLDPAYSYQVHDLLSGARFLWQGSRNYVELNPHEVPAHIFAVRRKVRTERDFDYYL